MIKFTLNHMLEKKQKTRYWLSKQTGIDNNTLAKIFNNSAKQIKLETLNKIIVALKCQIQDLIKYVPDSATDKQ
ncbi:helix-turn-helix transcriptional regulator [Clostridium tyrobutyricum]|uniref:helix-turn-helix domain-containing protein n=1 Tax=Clostridium tyrobutyricum TaxID=1519 RepID=UPI001C38B1D3|nr:helix-turn-helix transcriptional regulator [Clostridium tyrobutyricum]MBV4428720.1 helix-turn-helix transcriptional regulator [Clostridium tyrobutyricum]MBV4443861.1 helix-turn-helix transcriptional regulator [Clostridium tyrobutyricum]MBV4450025.1 helix-turn-helix transcriptional regulator [Clostridium tyrobutyricum]